MASTRKVAPFLPLIALLGLLASLLEGAGIGLFIPFLGLLFADPAARVPDTIRPLAELFGSYDREARAAMLAGAILALILLKGAAQAANEWLVTSVQERIGRDVGNRLAGKLLTLDYPFFLKNETSRLTHITVTDSWFVLEAARAALGLIPAIIGLLVFAALLAWLNLFLFLIVLVGATIIQATLYVAERRQKRLGQQFTSSYQHYSARLLTLVQAPRLIRLFGQQEQERRRAAQAIGHMQRSIAAGENLNAVVHPLVDALIALLFLGVVLVGYWRGLSIPALTAFILLLMRAQPHAKAISTARIGLAGLHSSVQAVEWLLSQPRSAPRPATIGGDVQLDRPISFEEVSYEFPNGHRALDKVSFVIQPGTATAMVGKSGSGKTTIVNLLCRLLEPQEGAIRLGGEPIDSFDRERWRRRIAVAGQDSELLPGSVIENIAYGRPDATQKEVEDAARAAGADKFIANLPLGFDTQVGLNGISLSGGQRQRIGLARALLTNPDLLILDEATNSVDALAETEIMKLISEHRYFHTMLIISHRKTTLAACRQGIVLDDGRVREAGPLDQLAYFEAMGGTPSAAG